MAMQREYSLFFFGLLCLLLWDRVRAQDHLSRFSRHGDGKLEASIKLKKELLSMRKLGQVVYNSDFQTKSQTLKVDDFMAKNGGTDYSQAFLEAWNKACSSSGSKVLVVPAQNYLLEPIKLEGPCKSNITVQITGTLNAVEERSHYKDDKWISFENVDGLVVEGGGTINGNGKIWWEQSCKIDKSKPCTKAPTALTFSKCKDLKVRNLKVQDAQQIHVNFNTCDNVEASGLTVSAPEDSPNTDGLHVTRTQNMRITDAIIGTGDDCISIEDGTENLRVANVKCGPGHGISIGSLGDDGKESVKVAGVIVQGAKLSGTTNGVRIKTYQGGAGTAQNITFQDIEIDNVQYPIIIDQTYCDKAEGCVPDDSSAVQISDVLYRNIKGTSASDVAVLFDCSKRFPCQGIRLEGVGLQSTEKKTTAECNNVDPVQSVNVSPKCP